MFSGKQLFRCRSVAEIGWHPGKPCPGIRKKTSPGYSWKPAKGIEVSIRTRCRPPRLPPPVRACSRAWREARPTSPRAASPLTPSRGPDRLARPDTWPCRSLRTEGPLLSGSDPGRVAEHGPYALPFDGSERASGTWPSLVKAPDWGSGERRFKSVRPDLITY